MCVLIIIFTVLYFDPLHSSQTYHCTTPRKIPANKMDPSCTVGMYCKGLAEFQALREQAEKVLAPPKQTGEDWYSKWIT